MVVVDERDKAWDTPPPPRTQTTPDDDDNDEDSYEIQLLKRPRSHEISLA